MVTLRTTRRQSRYSEPGRARRPSPLLRWLTDLILSIRCPRCGPCSMRVSPPARAARPVDARDGACAGRPELAARLDGRQADVAGIRREYLTARQKQKQWLSIDDIERMLAAMNSKEGADRCSRRRPPSGRLRRLKARRIAMASSNPLSFEQRRQGFTQFPRIRKKRKRNWLRRQKSRIDNQQFDCGPLFFGFLDSQPKRPGNRSPCVIVAWRRGCRSQPLA